MSTLRLQAKAAKKAAAAAAGGFVAPKGPNGEKKEKKRKATASADVQSKVAKSGGSSKSEAMTVTVL